MLLNLSKKKYANHFKFMGPNSCSACGEDMIDLHPSQSPLAVASAAHAPRMLKNLIDLIPGKWLPVRI